MRTCVTLFALSILLILPNRLCSQAVYDGNNNLPPFGSFSGSDFDIVSLQNGSLHLHIPIASWRQRGGKTVNMAFIYDTPSWTRTTSVASQVGKTNYYVTSSVQDGSYWWFVNPLSAGVVGGASGVILTCTVAGTQETTRMNSGYSFIDSEGTHHPLDIKSYSNSYCSNGPAISQSPTMDGTGTLVNTQTTLKNGTILSGTTVEDTNGNLVNTADTLDRSLFTTSTSGNTTTYTIYDSNGSPQNYVVTYTSASIATDFCKNDSFLNHPPQYTCVESSGGLQVPHTLTLPDNSSYTFSWYQNTPGQLQSVTLPTGATINYTYAPSSTCTHGPFGTFNSITIPYDCRSEVSSRQVVVNGVSSTWTYAAGGLVTDPYNNQEVHTSTSVVASSGTCAGSPGSFETQVQFYQGTANSGKLLKTIQTDYTAECDSYSIPSPAAVNVRPIRVTTTLDNGLVSKVETDYETFTVTNGSEIIPATRLNPIEKREYDYGSGAPGPLLRRTDYTYLHNNNSTYATLNIVDRPQSITVYNGSGTMVAQTTYEYDVYNHSGLPSMGVSGAVQHDSARGTTYTTRGNQTGVSRWVNTNSTWTTTNNQFDDAGNIIATRDPNLNITNFDYTDSWGNSTCAPPGGPAKAFATKLTNALNQVSKFTFNSCTGSVASSQTPNDIAANRAGTTFAYDMFGRTTQINYPDGGQTTQCFTDLGGSTCSQSGPPYTVVTTKMASPDPSVTTTTVYDGLDRVSETQVNSDPDGTTYVDTTYDSVGRVASVSNPYRTKTDSTYGITSYAYDVLGRTCVVVPPDGTSVANNTCPTTPPTNDVLTVYSGNTITVTDQASKSRTSVVDGLGHTTQIVEDPNGLGYVTNYTYDTLDNLTGVVQNGSRQRSFGYDSLSRILCASNPENSSAPCPTTVTSSYTPGTTGYSYDANGNLLSKTSPAPNQQGTATITLSYCYDALNRMTSKAYSAQSCPQSSPPPAASFTYDVASAGGLSISNPIGRLVAATTTGNLPTGTFYSYDSMGRVAILAQCAYINNCGAPTQSVWGVTNTYDLAGNLHSYTDGSGEVLTQAFDGAGRPSNLSSNWVDSVHPANLMTVDSTIGYYPNGALRKATFGNGLTEAFAYNNRLQPCRIGLNNSSNAYPSTSPCTASPLNGSLQDFMYCYGLVAPASCNGTSSTTSNNGNVSNWLAAGNSQTQNFGRSYSYDSLNRLQSVAYSSADPSGCLGYSWTYDAWGNMYNQSGSAGTCFSFQSSANAQNRLTVAGGVTYQYDAAGNMTYDGIHNYSYDAENRLQYVDYGSTATYVYNASGQRVAKGQSSGNTFYIYGADGQVVAERDSYDNWIQTYLHFGRQLVAVYRATGSNANTGFFFQDHLGSTRLITLMTNPTSPYDNMDYLPFGLQIAGGSGDSHKFTGKERDSESGLDNFGARYDSSSMGRFMSPDPENLSGLINQDDPQAWNGYAYVRNNPLLYTDPGGTNYTVCDTDGKNCADLTDKQFNQYLQDNPDVSKTASGDLYVGNTKVGSASYYNEKDVAAAQFLSGPVQNVVTKAAYVVGGAMAGVYIGTAYATYGVGTTALNLAGAGGAVAPLLYKSGDIIDEVVQTSAGPVRIYGEVVVDGTKIIIKDVMVYAQDSAGSLNVGVREMLSAIRPLFDGLKQAGFTAVQIVGDRISGANPGRVVDFTKTLR